MEAEELKKYLQENDISFEDYFRKMRQQLKDDNYNGPYCSCCGASHKIDKNAHTKECIHYNKP